jgi:isoquinoline 1-oxidoreductase beta subunit
MSRLGQHLEHHLVDDCGQPINPDIIKAQMDGGLGFGLLGAPFGAVDLEDGRVVHSNFNDYRQLQ